MRLKIVNETGNVQDTIIKNADTGEKFENVEAVHILPFHARDGKIRVELTLLDCGLDIVANLEGDTP